MYALPQDLPIGGGVQMSDNSQSPKEPSKGWKASLLTIYMLICQNCTPLLVAYCCGHFFAFTNDEKGNEGIWFQIVVFLEGLGLTFIVWISWRNFVSLIGDGISAVIEACNDWKSRFKPSQP